MQIKKYIVAIALAIAVSTSSAVQAESLDCGIVGNLAMSIMKNRQAGVPIQDIISAIKQASTSEDTLRIPMFIIQSAYSKPKFMTQRHQEEAVVEFGNEMFLACAKATGKLI